jgi:hypothetical protein
VLWREASGYGSGRLSSGDAPDIAPIPTAILRPEIERRSSSAGSIVYAALVSVKSTWTAS